MIKNSFPRIASFFIISILFCSSFAFASSIGGFTGGERFDSPSTSNFGSAGYNPSFQYARPRFDSLYSSDEISSYWPILRDIENDQCEATSDFVVMIRPGSCTPAVVRSDLLEEQNVPVFCQLDAVKVNPLIDVSSIKSISFKGEYPEGVAGISFHPARAAVRSYDTLLGSPLMNNIGYVVIILKRNSVEDDMPEWVEGNLTATIHYDAEDAYGVGEAEFYVPELSDEGWDTEHKAYSFWNGRGYVRVKDLQNNKARVSLYTDKDDEFREITLNKGETSDLMYFPGFYCKAGLKIKLNDVTVPADSVLLNIDGDEKWVREGSGILNGRCRVKGLNVLEDRTGSVEISCPGTSFELNLFSDDRFNFEVDSTNKEMELGKMLFSDGDKKYYLAYVGNVDISGEKEIAILLSKDDELEFSELTEVGKAVETVENDVEDVSNVENFEKEVGKEIAGIFGSREVKILVKDEEKEIEGNEIKFVGGVEKEDVGKLSDVVEDYFDRSQETVKELLDLYPQEKGHLERYGETSLWKQIELAEKIGKIEEKKELLNLFVEKYPDSIFIDKARDDLNQVNNFDFTSAYSAVYIGNDYHHISVSKFMPFDKNSKRIFVNVEGQQNYFYEGDRIGLGSKSEEWEEGEDFLLVEEIDVDEVILQHYYYDEGEREKGERFKMSAEETNQDLKKVFSLKRIEVESVAQVSLVPEVKNTKTEADFSFKIGIEKRAIELSTEKTKEMLRNLNETISEWKEINDNLGKLVKGWKGACFATSTLLMLKSLGSGFTGEGMARKKVMEAYRNKCDTDPKYKGMSHTQCYNALSDDIDSDVSAMTKVIEETNKEIKGMQQGYETSGGILGFDSYVDGQKAFEEKVKSKEGGVSFNIPGEDGEKELKFSEMTTWEDYKTWKAYDSLKKSGASDFVLEKFKQDMNSQLYGSWKLAEEKRLRDSAVNKIKEEYGAQPREVKILNKEGVVQTSWSGDVFKNFKFNSVEGVGGDRKVQFVNDAGVEYLLVLREGDIQKGVGVEKAYSLGNDVKEVEGEKLKDFQKYSFVSGGSCENPYLNPSVRFYELEPNKNLPALVAFDTRKGWYVKVPQSVGGIFSNNQKGYQSSGAVSFFYVCNVGANGREENMKGDDLCQSFDINNYGDIESFGGCPGLTSGEVQDLARKAQQAIQQASQQYGSRKLTILGQAIDLGSPVSGNGDLFECQDFMSPEDCKILFNVCDPVICPASRCDLGGKYPVSNVVQTGIIGSIFLCLPNAREGVMVPVCLTGIHAGIDNYISILESERACLETSLKTGQHVGICDAVTSVYLCEFFWRQFAPLMNIIIPKMIEVAYGQNVRGGGEYLTVQDSWKNLQGSIDYFKNEYAQNAFRAFEYRSVESAGTEVCRAFIGTSFPTSGDALDSLLEPESPPQFYAQFSEIEFTDATVPATSQYKVYYHIYAGKDRGVQYAIYLKNPPSSGYYSSSEKVNVESGYIKAGDNEDRSIDFTAPAGYKELCVVIDAQEECGFKQVTSDFGVNYLKEKYVEDQAKQKGVTTEKECISGSPSALGMANLNIQEGIEESVNPQIAMRGITRVCSTENPGIDKLNDSQWIDVGYCGNSNIRCWLDTKSLEGDLERVYAMENKSLKDIEKELGKVEGSGVLTEEESLSLLDSAKENIGNLKDMLGDNPSKEKVDGVVSDIEADLIDVENNGFLNSHKAAAMSLRAGLYRRVVELNYVPEGGSVSAGSSSDSSSGKDRVEEDDSDSGNGVGVVKGFSLDKEGKILKDGEYTGFYIEEKTGRRGVYETKERGGFDFLSRDSQIGSVLEAEKVKGKLNIVRNLVSDERKEVAEELKDYGIIDGKIVSCDVGFVMNGNGFDNVEIEFGSGAGKLDGLGVNVSNLNFCSGKVEVSYIGNDDSEEVLKTISEDGTYKFRLVQEGEGEKEIAYDNNVFGRIVVELVSDSKVKKKVELNVVEAEDGKVEGTIIRKDEEE